MLPTSVANLAFPRSHSLDIPLVMRCSCGLSCQIAATLWNQPSRQIVLATIIKKRPANCVPGFCRLLASGSVRNPVGLTQASGLAVTSEHIPIYIFAHQRTLLSLSVYPTDGRAEFFLLFFFIFFFLSES